MVPEPGGSWCFGLPRTPIATTSWLRQINSKPADVHIPCVPWFGGSLNSKILLNDSAKSALMCIFL